MSKKALIKEIFISILLLILIMLILAVALYDFIPANISIPEAISYSSDSKTTSVKQEIAYTNGGDITADPNQTDSELVTSLKSYSINASDLAVYSQKNLYNSGNSNPFDYAIEDTTQNNTTTEGNSTNTSNTTTTTNNQTATQTNTTTPGKLFEDSNSK